MHFPRRIKNWFKKIVNKRKKANNGTLRASTGPDHGAANDARQLLKFPEDLWYPYDRDRTRPPWDIHYYTEEQAREMYFSRLTKISKDINRSRARFAYDENIAIYDLTSGPENPFQIAYRQNLISILEIGPLGFAYALLWILAIGKAATLEMDKDMIQCLIEDIRDDSRATPTNMCSPELIKAALEFEEDVRDFLRRFHTELPELHMHNSPTVRVTEVPVEEESWAAHHQRADVDRVEQV